MMRSRGSWRTRLAVSTVLLVGTVLTVGPTPVSGRAPAAPAAAAYPAALPAQEEALPDPGETAIVAPGDATSSADAALATALADSATETVRVIVTTNVTTALETALPAGGVGAQRAAIASSLDEVAGALSGTGSKVLFRFTITPAAVVEVDADGLAALQASDAVASVRLDEAFTQALDVSTDTIDSDRLNTAGVLGNNWEGSPGPYTVVIIDSGVQLSHPAFAGGRIVDGACYSLENDCPNGNDSQQGISAGRNCHYSSECDHGTNVAGIAAGAANRYTHEGVARGARIISIQVGSNVSGSWRYYFSDLDRALQRTIQMSDGGRRIASVNMSLGGPIYGDAAQCGADFPNTQNLGAQLRARRVAPVAAAGNDSISNGVSYPSCLPSFYAVSAVDDSDTPAFFSNRDDQTDWWAPGVNIYAPVPTTSGGAASYSGTSMASPHVAGAFALLRECIGNSTPEDVAADLRAVGPKIPANGTQRRRINVLKAATRNVPNNDFSDARAISGARSSNTASFNVCADKQRGEPGPGPVDNSVWFKYRPDRTGLATITTNPGGGNPTTFNTEISVFRGSSLGDLQLVDYDDNSGSGNNAKVVMPVQAGVTYRIRVDGVDRQNGRFNLKVTRTGISCNGRTVTIVGTPGGDTIGGTPGNDVIYAYTGYDTVYGGEGNDTICGGAGKDRLFGRTGADTLIGDDGNDRLYGGEGSDAMYGGDGTDLCDGGPNGGDTASAGCETIVNVP